MIGKAQAVGNERSIVRMLAEVSPVGEEAFIAFLLPQTVVRPK